MSYGASIGIGAVANAMRRQEEDNGPRMTLSTKKAKPPVGGDPNNPPGKPAQGGGLSDAARPRKPRESVADMQARLHAKHLDYLRKLGHRV